MLNSGAFVNKSDLLEYIEKRSPITGMGAAYAYPLHDG